MSPVKLRYLLSALMICFICVSHAQVSPVIKIDTLSRPLTGELIEIYTPQQELSLEEVIHAPFRIASHAVPNLGSQSHSVWIRMTIQNTSPHPALVLSIDNPTLDEAELFYQEDRNGPFKNILISKNQPIRSRKAKVAEFVFPFQRIDTLPVTCYIRVKAEQPIILPLNVNIPNAQYTQTIAKNWLNGIYLGVVLIMALYNFFIYTSVRDNSYLYYVLFIVSAGMTQLILKGIAFQYFWPGSPFIEKYSMVFFASLSGITGLLFTRKFLELKIAFPLIDKIVLFSTVPFFVSILLVFCNQLTTAFLVMRGATTVASVIVFATAIYVLSHNRKASVVYFVVGWSFIILGSIIYLLYNYGLLPYNVFTNYSVQLSSAIEMTLFSFALASRINILEREREQSRRTALSLARENERIMKQQNIILEEEVLRRTEELTHKNEILNETYENLKQAQSRLVNAEKMSSLGQLTAGIAHEINNPINFVASNINPLKRDFKSLLDTITEIEKIGVKEESISEKQKEINQVKEEQDFDYLKTEITHLLNGIQDGANRTANIVRGLRIFSRVDEDDLKQADINEGLRSTLIISRNLSHDIEVIVEYGNIPQIYCYPGKLNQVFLNIVTNGIATIREKFDTNKGGQLHISTFMEGELVCVSIKDNGMGMSPEVQAKIFEPFFTTKKVGEGVGLGMSIVFSIIQQHRAEIDVKSELNMGSEFIIKLHINPDTSSIVSTDH